MTAQELQTMKDRITQLEAEKKMLKAAVGRTISFKVSTKGAVSVYGMGRFPVTLYKQQWSKLIESLPALQDFIRTNDRLLTTKA